VEVTRRYCLDSSWFGVLDLGIYGAVMCVGFPVFHGLHGSICDSAALADK
jgi:hypothetical protein